MSQQTVPVMNRRIRRSYDAARRQKLDLESEITITGETLDGREVTETFIAHPGRIPGAILVDFMKVGVYNDSEAMWDLFRCAFDMEPPKDDDGAPIPKAKSEFQRFHDFVRGDKLIIEAETLSQIISDIVEDGSGFPTQPSAG